MSAATQLLIRACKAQNRIKRLHSTYRKMFWSTDPYNLVDYHLASLLSKICDDYNVVKTSDLITALHTSNASYYGVDESDAYWTAVTKILSSKIRLGRLSKFVGFKTPLRFKQPGINVQPLRAGLECSQQLLNVIAEDYQKAINEQKVAIKKIITICSHGAQLIQPNLTVNTWSTINRILPEFCSAEHTRYFQEFGILSFFLRRRSYDSAVHHVQQKLAEFLYGLITRDNNDLEVVITLWERYSERLNVIGSDRVELALNKLVLAREAYWSNQCVINALHKKISKLSFVRSTLLEIETFEQSDIDCESLLGITVQVLKYVEAVDKNDGDEPIKQDIDVKLRQIGELYAKRA